MSEDLHDIFVRHLAEELKVTASDPLHLLLHLNDVSSDAGLLVVSLSVIEISLELLHFCLELDVISSGYAGQV